MDGGNLIGLQQRGIYVIGSYSHHNWPLLFFFRKKHPVHGSGMNGITCKCLVYIILPTFLVKMYLFLVMSQLLCVWGMVKGVYSNLNFCDIIVSMTCMYEVIFV